jgi:hypothetical protein
LSALARRLDEIPPPLVPEPMPEVVHRYSSEVAKMLRDAWPKSGTGEIVGVWLDLEQADRVRVSHLGAPLGPAGTQLLARAVERTAGSLQIEEDALVPVEAELADAAAWLPRALDLLRRSRAARLQLCITLARAPAPKPRGPAVPADISVVRAIVQKAADGAADVSVFDGDRWSAIPSQGTCEAPAAPPAPPAARATSARPSGGSGP